MNADEIITLAEQLYKDGYNPNTIVLDFEQVKKNLLLHITHSQNINELRDSLKLFSLLIGNSHNAE